MPTRLILTLVVAALAVAGCGSAGSRAASRPDPPAPVTLSVYIDAHAVRVSPARLGAGPVLLTVADQGPRAAALVVSRARSTAVIARTAPINPDAVTQVKVDLPPGRYTVAAIVAGRRTDAQRTRAQARSVTTWLRVTTRRPGSGGAVLQP